MCKENIIPESLGIYDCSYTWSGTKFENNLVKRIRIQKWRKVGNEFKYFDPQENGNAKWGSLKIMIRYDLPDIICGVCKIVLSDNSIKLDCLHSYHEICLKSLNSEFNKKCILY